MTDYSALTVSLYAVSLWDGLKFEVLNVQEEELAEQALDALSNIAAKLSGSPDLQSYLKPVIKECNEHLEDAPTKQSQASGRIIRAIAMASPEASNFLTKAVTPQIVSLFNASGSIGKRRALLDVNLQLLRANIVVFGDWRTSDPEFLQKSRHSENAARDFSDQLRDLLLNAVETSPKEEVSYRILCISGLTELVKLRSVLPDQQISGIMQLLTIIILKGPSYEIDDLRHAAETGLLEIARQKPQLVVDGAFPLFLAELPEDVGNEDPSGLPILAAFARLSSEEKIFETTVMRLKNRLAIAIQRPASGTFILALLNALLYAFFRGAYKDLAPSAQKSYYPNMVLWLFDQLQKSNTVLRVSAERATILNAIGRICRIILLRQDDTTQQEMAGKIYNIDNSTEGSVLNHNSPPEQQDLLIISTHLLAAVKAEIGLSLALPDLLRQLISRVDSDGATAEIKAASLSQIMLIVNRHIPEADLKSVLDDVGSNRIDQERPASADSLDVRIEFAISKALVLRNSRLATGRISNLLQLLPNDIHGPSIARGFSAILAPDEFLTHENHCRISKLHQQKLFSLTVPVIATSYRKAPDSAKKNYLVALSGILHWVPYPIIAPELPSLVPLLLQSIDATSSSSTLDTPLRAGAIHTLMSVLAHNPDAVAEHANSLASRLLAAARPEGAKNEASVRVVALSCLALLPAKLRRETVMPFRMQVVKQLTGALDDAKRSVRREAVRCRVAWIGLDDGAEE